MSMLPPLMMMAVAAMGWTDIAVQPSKGHSAYLRGVASLTRPSERTVETLKRYDLETRYRRDPNGVLASLENAARRTMEPELVYALAELSWIEGQSLESRRLAWRRQSEALDRYLDAVGYAADFLFDPELAAGRQPTDPRFRLACELYNGGLERLIQAAQVDGKILPGESITLKLHGGEQSVRVALVHSRWKPGDVDELILASDFTVTGLDSRSRTYGVGVPLIGIRRGADREGGQERFYPPEMAFPLTAFLLPNSKLRDAPDNGDAPRECTLELIDPVGLPQVGPASGPLPVESDVTTPLAYMWSHTDLSRYRWKGLLRPEQAADRAGLMLLRPYEPGKVPVVMVHGLISTPLAWIAMVNELLRDPQIQPRYQFLLYLYPTGVPVPIAAAGLREALLDAQRTFNPDARDPAFNRMVLLGHSMGGLLSHAMIVDSGDKFWKMNTFVPFNEILGPPDVLGELKTYMFFDAMPFINRVVFLATPHRGSALSRRMVGRLSSGLISEPDHVSNLLTQLIKDNPDAFDRRRFRRLPTSIDTLDPDSPVLKALLEMQVRPGVKLHSIIGASHAGPPAQSTDGIVPYTSSHLDGVESERVVISGHGVQQDPEAILEVRRILLQHLQTADPQLASPIIIPTPR